MIFEETAVETYFNTKGLAEYLIIPEQTIRRWVMNNEIPYYRIHNVIRYRLSDIETWVDAHKEKVPAFMSGKQAAALFNETEEGNIGGSGETEQGSETAESGSSVGGSASVGGGHD
jgi:excisionase family DNA binding protein